MSQVIINGSLANSGSASFGRLRRWLASVGVLGTISAVIIGTMVIVAVIGALIAPHDPTKANVGDSWDGPRGGHLLGFDANGRDLLSRLLVGTRSAMLGPLAVVGLSVIAGVVVAIVSAWRGGRVDALLGGITDMVFAFPGILIAILAATVTGAGIGSAVIALSIAYTPYIARTVRSAALGERGRAYIAALEVQGLSGWMICRRHLLPNVTPLIVAQATVLFGYAMVDLAAISYIGLGVQPPHPDWGAMINENQGGIVQQHPTPVVIVGLVLVAVVVAFNVLGHRLSRRSGISK